MQQKLSLFLFLPASLNGFAICKGWALSTQQSHPKVPPKSLIAKESNVPSTCNEFILPTRRNAISSVFTAPFMWSILTEPSHASSAASLDAGEAIRRSAANIPGFGQTDVFYPESFGGTWKVTRNVEFNGSATTLSLQYSMRFIQSIENGAVVADRGYNQAQLERAIFAAVKGSDQAASTDAVRSYEWVPSNPNDLRIVFSDGTKKEIKVTKRATERTSDTVSASEFQRVTQEDEQMGIPVISARRVISKWKTVNASALEAIEIVYDMGGGDPIAGASSQSSTMLSKSKLLLVR